MDPRGIADAGAALASWGVEVVLCGVALLGAGSLGRWRHQHPAWPDVVCGPVRADVRKATATRRLLGLGAAVTGIGIGATVGGTAAWIVF